MTHTSLSSSSSSSSSSSLISTKKKGGTNEDLTKLLQVFHADRLVPLESTLMGTGTTDGTILFVAIRIAATLRFAISDTVSSAETCRAPVFFLHKLLIYFWMYRLFNLHPTELRSRAQIPMLD